MRSKILLGIGAIIVVAAAIYLVRSKRDRYSDAQVVAIQQAVRQAETKYAAIDSMNARMAENYLRIVEGHDSSGTLTSSILSGLDVEMRMVPEVTEQIKSASPEVHDTASDFTHAIRSYFSATEQLLQMSMTQQGMYGLLHDPNLQQQMKMAAQSTPISGTSMAVTSGADSPLLMQFRQHVERVNQLNREREKALQVIEHGCQP